MCRFLILLNFHLKSTESRWRITQDLLRDIISSAWPISGFNTPHSCAVWIHVGRLTKKDNTSLIKVTETLTRTGLGIILWERDLTLIPC